MLCFFIVTKLLMLKLLLASISGLNGYDFGYHPSAEEFDNFLRESQRTWTRDLLANDRRRAWTVKPPMRDTAGYFVPKYNYDEERTRVAPSMQTVSWPGRLQRVGKPSTQSSQLHHYEQPNAVTTDELNNGHSIGSSLDFTMFSMESDRLNYGENSPAIYNSPVVIVPPQKQQPAYQSYAPHKIKVIKPFTTVAHVTSAMPTTTQLSSNQPIKQTVGAVVEIASSNEAPKLTPNEGHDKPYKNSTDAQFPIFFTNPVTGIVYAITQVGKMQDNVTNTNGTIPIYITKEQYDRDLFLQRKYYESRCHDASRLDTSTASAVSAISAPSNTTTRPQIIRLHHPDKSVSKLPFAKLATQLPKPPPVMVQTELTVRDQIKLPTRKHKTKRRKKKTGRPGRKPSQLGNVNPDVILSNPKDSSPYVFRGTRISTKKPSISTDSQQQPQQQLSTQLEKPSLTTTIFSKSAPLIRNTSTKSPSILRNHRMRRRSVTNTRDFMERTRTSGNPNSTQLQQMGWRPQLESTFVVRPSVESARSTQRINERRKRLPKHRNNTVHHGAHMPGQFNRTHNVLHLNKKSTNSTSATKKPINTTLNITSSTTPKQPINKNNTIMLESTTREYAENIAKNATTRMSKTKKKDKNKSGKKQNSRESLFDFLDLVGDDDDDDSVDKDDDKEKDDSYEDDDSYYDYDQSTKQKQKHRHKFQTPSSLENKEDFSEEISGTTTLREPVTQDNASTAEEGADFGAMGSIEAAYQSDHTTNSYTKSSATKKRIRRRPPGESSASYEDYDDDDGGDGSNSGISSFFRMIFYPVQLLMGNIADSFASKEVDDEYPPFPTYTQYNNGIQPYESEEEEEEQSNSLTSWFSSWFGFNRRTKNIANTTPYPAPTPAPTEAPGWFESWFGFGGNKAEANADDANDDKWFFGWFDTKPKRRRKTTTTTTTVRTPPQVPILTIVDPLKNPQNWIGILAHHIINSTTTTTTKPLMEAITRATINPDIPRMISYDKYQIWRLKPIDDGQVKALEDYKNSDEGIKLQWLKGPSLRGLTDVLVPPKQLVDFEASLSFESIAHEVLIYDVGKAIAYEKAQEHYYFNAALRPNKNHKNQKYQPLNTISWHKYYEYEDIITHLEMLRMRHPQLIELIHIGRSYEGRPLVIVKLESKEHQPNKTNATEANQMKLKNKKKTKEANAAFIESGTHGLEWIGPATSLWMISELLRLIKSNKTGTEYDFIKHTTWLIMPILNPDGYVYTHQYDRFWRKSRSRHIARPGGIINSAMTWLQQKKLPERVCFGVDLDRNWHYQWGRRGSSKSPCNENYAGPGPFSEPETKALSEFLIDYRKQIKLYISLQAYGQIISYPMKVNASFNAERIDDFLDVAMVGTDGLRKKGSKTRYKIDSINDLVENRSGCSDAFASYEVGIPFSYTIQLADNGVHGYLLPSSSIESTARDTFEIITAMVDYI